MTETWYPNPGVTQLQHERLLGRALPSGVLGHPTDPTVVYANGTGTREIRIRADKQAVVRGYGWQNDAAEIVKTLAANTSGSTRTDLVVLRYSRADYSVTVQIVQGTPGAGAPAPTYNTDASGVWELPLANVAVANNATTIAASAVTRRCWYLGEDGQILCTSTIHPPHAPGRTAFETDTSNWVLSDGTAWSSILDDSGVLSLTLENGWSATARRVQRRSGVVVLALDASKLASISGGTSVKVGQLPAGTFPTFEVPGTAQYESSAGLSVGLRVTTAGGVYIDVPNSITINANRPLVGSLTWHAA